MEPQTANLNVVLPAELINRVKMLARMRGVLLRRFVQDALQAQVDDQPKGVKAGKRDAA